MTSAVVVLAARPANCGPFVCCEACAGRSVCWLCPPAVPCSAGLFVCLPAFCLCHAHCPSHVLAPVHFTLLFPCSFPCAPGSSFESNQHVCKLRDCPVGSNNAGLQWRPAHRVVSITPLPVLQDCLQAAAPWRLHLGSPCAVVRHP